MQRQRSLKMTIHHVRCGASVLMNHQMKTGSGVLLVISGIIKVVALVTLKSVTIAWNKGIAMHVALSSPGLCINTYSGAVF